MSISPSLLQKQEVDALATDENGVPSSIKILIASGRFSSGNKCVGSFDDNKIAALEDGGIKNLMA